MKMWEIDDHLCDESFHGQQSLPFDSFEVEFMFTMLDASLNRGEKVY